MARSVLAWIWFAASISPFACSGPSSPRDAEVSPGASHGPTSPSETSTAESPPTNDGSRTSTGGAREISISIDVEGSNGATPSTCAAHTANAERRPIYLAFAFDISGSMGKLDEPWHDPALKWKPVVTATEDFFAGADSTGIWASLTFFPAEEDECDAETYGTPDVPMTLLPSSAFSDEITKIAPQSADDWRGGTPTLAVLKGVFHQLERATEKQSNAAAAVVLVTDGHPQGCDDNAIDLVQSEVAAHSAIPTFVIGVENPPIDDAPDTVSNLHGIASAGNTEAAFLIQTGDPKATSKQFAAVIEQIRGAAISCEYTIPAPPAGETLDTGQVNVTYRTVTNAMPFVYDPDCSGSMSWHYDDATRPSAVVLCPDDCAKVMEGPDAQVMVEFGCEQRTPVLQ